MDQEVRDFWEATRAILEETPTDAEISPNEELSGREYETWDVALRSFGGQRLRGFYTTPETSRRRASFRRCWPFPDMVA
jgi:cephalosporin-C deacetylase-like acetyl esterase